MKTSNILRFVFLILWFGQAVRSMQFNLKYLFKDRSKKM